MVSAFAYTQEADIKKLSSRLGEANPGPWPRLDRGVAVGIDGRIYRDTWLEPVAPDRQAFILPCMLGGEDH